MRFGGYHQDERSNRTFIIPSDSYMDSIAVGVGISAQLTAYCSSVYYLFRNRTNTALRTRLVKSLTQTPRLAAMVAGYSLISSSVDCSLVSLRGKGDNFNTFVGMSLFFGLLARRRGPVFASAAGLMGGTAIMSLLNNLEDILSRLKED